VLLAGPPIIVVAEVVPFQRVVDDVLLPGTPVRSSASPASSSS
jgi:hypothetical protein